MTYPSHTHFLSNAVRPRTRIMSMDSPLRIVFFSDVYAPQVNGVAVSLQLLAGCLRTAGHEVTIFAPRFPGYRDPEPNVYRVPAVRVMHTPPIYVALPATPRTTLALRRCRFDVIHSHSPLSLGMLAYGAASAKDVPLVYTYHTSIADYTHYLKVGGQSRPIRWAARWFSATTTNLGDHIVVPSAKFKRVLLEQNVRRPIRTIPNGIDLGNFHEPKSPGLFRQQLGLNSEAPLLLYVGRVDPEKRIDFLIEAFTRVAAARPDAHLVVAGDGSARRALEGQAAESGCGQRIHFLGMVKRSDLPGLLHDADLFLSASTSETQCLAMVEAIAAGLPVVAVWDEAFEGILADSVNGRTAPREAGAFGGVVNSLLADPATLKAFGGASVKLSWKFSVEAQATAVVELYREAILKNHWRLARSKR
ncbi:MAG TPA: glycosyltransferase [Anaerolineales bacterium]|nr:glycosyltransferase [Anaerolineales bacterium]